MKRTFFVIFSTVCLCLGLAIIVPSFIDFSKYKTKGEQEFKKLTGLDISLNGDIDFNILPAPRFIISNASIAAPEGSKSEKLASFERLEVNLDLMPLFSGSVSVNSLTLVKPVIMLEAYKDGKLNAITTELEKSTNVNAKASTKNVSNASFTPNISLDQITIKDGSFSYLDHKSGNEIAVQNINADLSAKSLMGPFKGRGSLFYEGNSLNFDLSTDKYDSDNKIISPNVKLTIQPSNLLLEYAGVMNLANGVSIQGQTQISSKDLARSLSGYGIKNISGLSMPLMAKGMLSANQSHIDYKSAEIILGDQKINGSVQADLKPFKFRATAKTVSDIDLNKFYSADIPFKKAFIDMKISGNDAVISLNNSDIILDGHKFKISGDYKANNKTQQPEINIDINALDIIALAKKFNIDSSIWDRKYKQANVKTKILNIGGDMDITANIDALGGKIIAKGGVNKLFSAEDIALQIKHGNMAKILYMLMGSDIKSGNLSHPLDIYMKLSQSSKSYILKDIKGDMSGINMQGDVALDLSGKKPSIKGNLNFAKLNIDSVMSASQSNSGKTSGISKSNSVALASSHWSKQIIDTNALHAANLDLNLSAKEIKYGSWPLINPSLKLYLKDGSLNISNLKSGLFDGNITFSGNVKSSGKEREPINFDSKFNIKGADLGKLSTALIAKQIVKISGKGNLDMSISSTGASPAALIDDLSGQGILNGSNIILDGVDITKFARALSTKSRVGDSLSGIWNGASKGGQTYFDALDGAFTIKNGVVYLEKMDLDGAESSIKTTGNINLPKWTLATKHKIMVKGIDGAPSDVPEFEMSFNGSLDNPAQTFGQGLLQDYLNRKIEHKLNKMISGKLGKKLGIPSNDNSEPQKTDGQKDSGALNDSTDTKTPEVKDVAEDAIKGILGDLLH